MSVVIPFFGCRMYWQLAVTAWRLPYLADRYSCTFIHAVTLGDDRVILRQ